MQIYKALQEEDDYIRLQMLSEGIKQITIEMPKVDTIKNSSLIKFLLCAYPFEPSNIEMLVNAFFDYYQNENFFWAFTQAILTIGEYPESRIIKQSFKEIISRAFEGNNKQSIQYKHYYHFCEKAQLEIPLVKQFICTLLKKYFSLASALCLNLSKIYDIYRIYLTNTNNKELIFQLIESFENLKNEYFINEPWVDNFQEEIDCYKTSLIPQKLFDKKSKIQKTKLVKENLNKLYSQFKEQKIQNLQKQEGSNQQINDNNNHIILEQKNQKILDKLEIEEFLANYSINSSIPDSMNIYTIIKFIIHPRKYELSDIWGKQFQDCNIQKEEYGFKINSEELEDYYIIRSYQSLYSLLNQHQEIKLRIQQLLPKLFRQIKKVLTEQNINMNLNHFAFLLDFILKLCAKQSIYQIIKYNIMFNLIQFFYNKYIVNICLNILDYQTDIYKFGQFIQEQMWNYIICCDWFEQIHLIVFQLQCTPKQEEEYSEDQMKILQMLQSLNRNYKNSIFQPNGSHSKINSQTSSTSSIASNQQLSNDLLNDQDIDNLNQFNKEKSNFTIQQREILQKSIDESKKYVNHVNIIKIPIKKSQQQEQIPRMSIQQKLQEISIKKKPSNQQLPKLNSFKSPQQKANSPLSQGSFQNISIDVEVQPSIGSLQSSFSSKKNRPILSQRGSIKSEESLGRNSKVLIVTNQQQNKVMASLFKQKQSNQKIIELRNYETQIFIQKILEIIVQQQIVKQQQQLYILTNKLIKIIPENCIILFYQTYLSKIIKDDIEIDISLISGAIINLIYKITITQQLTQYYDILNEQSYNFLEDLTQQIDNIEKTQHLINFKRYTLIQTYCYIFKLNSIIEQNYLEVNIYKYFKGRTFEKLQQLFFNFATKSIFQIIFVELINSLFQKAPAYLLQQILFNCGFLSQLFETEKIYLLNNLLPTQESLLFFILNIVNIISTCLEQRKLNVILDNLKPLDSWKYLIKGLEGQNSQQLTLTMNNCKKQKFVILQHLTERKQNNGFLSPNPERRVYKPSISHMVIDF